MSRVGRFAGLTRFRYAEEIFTPVLGHLDIRIPTNHAAACWVVF